MWSGAALGNVAQSTVAANAYVKKVFFIFYRVFGINYGAHSYLTFNDLPY